MLSAGRLLRTAFHPLACTPFLGSSLALSRGGARGGVSAAADDAASVSTAAISPTVDPGIVDVGEQIVLG